MYQQFNTMPQLTVDTWRLVSSIVSNKPTDPVSFRNIHQDATACQVEVVKVVQM